MLGVLPIICYSRFSSGVLKIQRIEEFSLGFEGNGKFRKKYILQPRAHNFILPMPIDTLPFIGASRYTGVTLVGRRSNSTKHSLRADRPDAWLMSIFEDFIFSTLVA